jgi:hypothetical protein
MKTLITSERPAGAPKFDFSGASTLIIHSCAPVSTERENAFWRKIIPVEE